MKKKEEGKEEVEDEKEVDEEEEVKEQEVGADREREGASLVDSQDWFLNTTFRIHFMDFFLTRTHQRLSLSNMASSDQVWAHDSQMTRYKGD